MKANWFCVFPSPASPTWLSIKLVSHQPARTLSGQDNLISMQRGQYTYSCLSPLLTLNLPHTGPRSRIPRLPFVFPRRYFLYSPRTILASGCLFGCLSCNYSNCSWRAAVLKQAWPNSLSRHVTGLCRSHRQEPLEHWKRLDEWTA